MSPQFTDKIRITVEIQESNTGFKEVWHVLSQATVPKEIGFRIASQLNR